ncbi:GDSL-type esterase/lipase family protein [Fodinicola feengrottensis]|uniref:GDSL-type esterase/lipase family protein n=1 Tax=Fodinicola feengrottensis TaxID=435914 RepID=UPI0024424843|nr:GDSL-type esterase/lipase family protein [Fodinicola feengrottensis]
MALGDSYAAGPLIPLPRLDPLLCVRSTNDYAALLASHLGLWSYTDNTCSGADTSNMTGSQSLVLGSHAPQFDGLTAATDLVSISIGGNDYSVFGSIVGTCPGLKDSDPTGAPCKAHFTVNGTDTLLAALANTTRPTSPPSLTAFTSDHRTRRCWSSATPRLTPTSGYCADLPLADGDYAWADSLERALNAAASSAAAATGSTFVDTYGPSLGHDVCARRRGVGERQGPEPAGRRALPPVLRRDGGRSLARVQRPRRPTGQCRHRPAGLRRRAGDAAAAAQGRRPQHCEAGQASRPPQRRPAEPDRPAGPVPHPLTVAKAGVRPADAGRWRDYQRHDRSHVPSHRNRRIVHREH